MALDLVSIQHVNVNCSNLERSLAFYREIVGLTPMSHTKPAPQDGEGFGLSGQVQWDAHLLHDHRAHEGPAVDLLEWQIPKPTGSAPASINQLGLSRLCFRVPDISATYAKVVKAGHVPVSPPAQVVINAEAGINAHFFCVPDPDGSMVEFLEGEGPNQMHHVCINCSDIEASAAWYQEVLGMQLVGVAAPEPMDGSWLGFNEDAVGHGRFMAVPGQARRFLVELIEWTAPAPSGEAARAANQLGMFRMAFMVPDAARAAEDLKRRGVETSDPVWLDMGPDIPIDGLWAVFFRDPDGTCLELIQTPT